MANMKIAGLILCFILIGDPSHATLIIVGGDDAGWALGVNYTEWAASHILFTVGDTIVFLYSGSHTADEVSRSDYMACSSANPISSDNSGYTEVELETPGTHYFISNNTGDCSSGMKLAIDVEKKLDLV